MSLIFNIEERKIEFMGNSFPMNKRIVSKFQKEFGGNISSFSLSLDTPKEEEKTLKKVFPISKEIGNRDGHSLLVVPPLRTSKFWYVIMQEKIFFLQREGDGRPALDWAENPQQELLREFL